MFDILTYTTSVGKICVRYKLDTNFVKYEIAKLFADRTTRLKSTARDPP